LTAAVNARMGPRDITELVSLAMLWGGSFLFMRMGAAEFGPVVLSALRLIGASLLLMPLLLWRGQWESLRQHWRPIFVVGVTNSALPFVCFAYAALSINAGLMAIFNAATPLFAAVIAWWWLKDSLTPLRIAGLVIGFIGVAWLAFDKASFKPGGSGWAVVACLVASALYGFQPISPNANSAACRHWRWPQAASSAPRCSCCCPRCGCGQHMRPALARG
jgi:drug/metabolite transporter (DMT)-like permease